MATPKNTAHTPVLLKEVLQQLDPKDGETYIDGTFGAGGYSQAILEEADCTVYAIDQDPDTKSYAADLSHKFPSRFHYLEGNYANMDRLLPAEVKKVNGVVLDIGVSSMQLDQADRGFSFMHDGALDMRMSQEGPTAAEILNTMPEAELADIIYQFGGERKSRQIAKVIINERNTTPITRTKQLTQLVHSVIHRRKHDKIDPATRTFQALRIYINQELDALTLGLKAAENCLESMGRLVVVTFHSLEDRIVKSFFNEACGKVTRTSRHIPENTTEEKIASFTPLTRKAITPSDKEINSNPRARSAKLRAASRTNIASRFSKEVLC